MRADFMEARFAPVQQIAIVREFVRAVRKFTAAHSSEYKRATVFWLLPHGEDAQAIYEEYPHLALMSRCREAKFFVTPGPLDWAPSFETIFGNCYAV